MPGRDPARARARFAEIFDISDEALLEHYFSGETLIVRRNLDRKEGGSYYARLRKHGLESALVKIEIEAPARPAEPEVPAESAVAAAIARQEPARAAADSRQLRREGANERKRQRKAAAVARKQARIEAKRKQREEAEAARQREADAQLQRERAEQQAEARAPAPETAAAAPSPVANSTRATTAPAQAAPAAPVAASVPAAAKTAPGAVERKRIRSALDLSAIRQRKSSSGGSRRSEAPNAYRLQPFRNTPEIRRRAALAQTALRRGMFTAGTAFALLLILLGSFIAQRPTPTPAGPAAIAGASDSKLYLLIGDTLLQHDRAGVPEGEIELQSWGLEDARQILLPGPDGQLLLWARAAQDEAAEPALWSCRPAEQQCSALLGDYQTAHIDALTRHDLSGDLLLADVDQGRLLRVDNSGKTVADASLDLPDQVLLRLDTGLLFINSATAPTLSVLRIEPSVFGHQIDELFLLAPPALEAGQTHVVDFLRLGEQWWATMENPETRSLGTYRFDSYWSYLGQVERKGAEPSARMTAWKDKVLFSSPRSGVIRRYNSEGQAEANFSSPLLDGAIASGQQRKQLEALAWRLVLLLCAAVSVLGFAYAGLQWMRKTVFSRCKEQGADALDSSLDQVRWAASAPGRQQQLRRYSTAYFGLAVGVILIAVACGVSAVQLLALLIALSGPLIVLQTLLRSPVDHLGLLGGKVILVDHLERYHAGRPTRLRQRGPFYSLDDVIIYTGTSLLPAMHREAGEMVLVANRGSVPRASWSEVLIRLRESNHPVARGGLGAIAALMLGLLILVIGQLPL